MIYIWIRHKPDKPNLDLINMVQQARMMHDNEATPSEVSAVYWIETKDQSGKAKAPTPRSGQWMLELDVTQVDSAYGDYQIRNRKRATWL